jgi:hypothetical protein
LSNVSVSVRDRNERGKTKARRDYENDAAHFFVVLDIYNKFIMPDSKDVPENWLLEKPEISLSMTDVLLFNHPREKGTLKRRNHMNDIIQKQEGIMKGLKKKLKALDAIELNYQTKIEISELESILKSMERLPVVLADPEVYTQDDIFSHIMPFAPKLGSKNSKEWDEKYGIPDLTKMHIQFCILHSLYSVF